MLDVVRLHNTDVMPANSGTTSQSNQSWDGKVRTSLYCTFDFSLHTGGECCAVLIDNRLNFLQFRAIVSINSSTWLFVAAFEKLKLLNDQCG